MMTFSIPRVSEELNSVETAIPRARWVCYYIVSEELNSVETESYRHHKREMEKVSEELNSVETGCIYGVKQLTSPAFQKNLIVWKPAENSIL